MIKKYTNPTSRVFKTLKEVFKMSVVKSDIEIARAAKMKPIKDVLDYISVPDEIHLIVLSVDILQKLILNT